MTPDLGIKPGPHWWEASALATAPSLHPVVVVVVVVVVFLLSLASLSLMLA